MDTNRCVGHYIRGANQGQRCRSKGAVALFHPEGPDGLKVCERHYGYYQRYANPWLREIITRAILGRYNAPG